MGDHDDDQRQHPGTGPGEPGRDEERDAAGRAARPAQHPPQHGRGQADQRHGSDHGDPRHGARRCQVPSAAVVADHTALQQRHAGQDGDRDQRELERETSQLRHPGPPATRRAVGRHPRRRTRGDGDAEHAGVTAATRTTGTDQDQPDGSRDETHDEQPRRGSRRGHEQGLGDELHGDAGQGGAALPGHGQRPAASADQQLAGQHEDEQRAGEQAHEQDLRLTARGADLRTPSSSTVPSRLSHEVSPRPSRGTRLQRPRPSAPAPPSAPR